tara:strand:- start:1796 stop:2053 length:258 start_codon:yes stop_codon:yes gene_type:complete
MKYKVTYDREGCIGAAACVAAFEDMWEIDEEGKAVILFKNVKKLGNGLFEVEIDEGQLEKVKESAQVCPVNVIHIENLETGEKII